MAFRSAELNGTAAVLNPVQEKICKWVEGERRIPLGKKGYPSCLEPQLCVWGWRGSD